MPDPGSDSRSPARDDVAGLAAHEIRSQLAVLNGYLSMLEDGSLGRLPDAARSVLSPMRAKTRAISRMVDDMLEDARQQDGRLHLSRRAVDLRTVLETVADEARIDLPDSHRLTVQIPDRPVTADVDPRRVATILRNLIDNAIKYSPDGGEIGCQVELAGAEARITVSDSGIGIDPADAEKVFQRFERGAAASSRPAEGVGLGLYISRTLARLHGGDITITDRRGAGSEFTVRLPRANSAGGRH